MSWPRSCMRDGFRQPYTASAWRQTICFAREVSDKFQALSADYLGDVPGLTTRRRTGGVIYTCPAFPKWCAMHLAVARSAAWHGTARLTDEDNTELDDMTRRFRVSTVLALRIHIDGDGVRSRSATHAGFCFDDRSAGLNSRWPLR